MDKIDLVRAALRGIDVERVPASFWFHFTPEKSSGDASVRAHLDYFAESGIDFLKVMNEHFYQLHGVDLQTPSDWRRIRPAPLHAGFFRAQLYELDRILDELQGECLVISTVYNPFACGNQASRRRLTEHLKADPKSVNEGLKAIADALAEFAQACVDNGASGIYFAVQGGEKTRFTQEEFLSYIKPHDLTVLNAVVGKGEFHLLHICKEGVRLPLYADYPSHAVNWAVTKNSLSLKEGRSLFNRTVMGGLDDRGILVSGDRASIQAAVQKVILECGNKGLILGADCTLPTDIPIDNIRTAVEATALMPSSI
jgi:uroporphyrinogen decarboxylase